MSLSSCSCFQAPLCLCLSSAKRESFCLLPPYDLDSGMALVELLVISCFTADKRESLSMVARKSQILVVVSRLSLS